MEIKEIKELKEGKVIAIDSQDQEVEIDIAETLSKLSTVNAESASRRIRLKEVETEIEGLKNQLKGFEGKKIVDPEEIDTEKNQIVEGYKTKLTEKESKIAEKDQVIRKLLISNEFARSEYFSGNNKKTILTPDIAESYFSKHFEINEHNNVVAKRGDGTPIMSKENPESYAGFGEAISVLIEEYPNKDSILAAPHAGDGMKQSNSNSNFSGITKRSDLKNSKMSAEYISKHGLEAFKKLK